MLKTRKETGQSIVLIAVMIFGLLALSALIVDGGNMYLNHRQAQTAADAAALAAAVEMCLHQGSFTTADAVAQDYALNKNPGTHMVDLSPEDGGAPYIIIDSEAKSIRVAVGLTHSTFFAKVFGRPTTTVEADASAGCFPVGYAGGLLPVAWTCRPPIPGGDYLGDDQCAMKGMPKDVFDEIVDSGFDFKTSILDDGDGENSETYYDDPGGLTDPKILFLISDSLKVDSFNDPNGDPSLLEDVCIEANPEFGVIDCDFAPEDGVYDIDGGAGRGWLTMSDNAPSAAELSCIIKGEEDWCKVNANTPHWYLGAQGSKKVAFGDIDQYRVGDYALVPVFDAVCDTTNPINDPVNCPEFYGREELCTPKDCSSQEWLWYRVNGFAIFYITCVSKTPGDKCPGKTRAIEHLAIDNNTSTIEGYFIEFFIPDDTEIGDSSLDLGVYVISLSE